MTKYLVTQREVERVVYGITYSIEADSEEEAKEMVECSGGYEVDREEISSDFVDSYGCINIVKESD